VCCSVLQCVAAGCCSVLQCVAVCCSRVLQCVAVCCSVLQLSVVRHLFFISCAAYRTWSFMSSVSDLNRWSRFLGLFCHGSSKRDLWVYVSSCVMFCISHSVSFMCCMFHTCMYYCRSHTCMYYSHMFHHVYHELYVSYMYVLLQIPYASYLHL